MAKKQGIAWTILRGRDNCSPISKATMNKLYVSHALEELAYAQIQAQLDMMEKHVRMFAPKRMAEEKKF